MRMDFLFGNFFWGLLLILLGLSIFLKGFNISLPLVKVFFAIIVIMFGVRILVGGKPRVHTHRPYYKHGATRTYSSNRQEYEFVFSGGTLDLSNVKADAKDMEITVVFGTATVILPANVKFDIETSNVFGATYLPQNNYTGFGEDTTTLNSESANSPVHIESTAVFGRIEYVLKDMPKQDTSAAGADSSKVNTEF